MAGVNGSDARTVVAVIGAGIMGSAMARNLAAAGLDTQVWDRSPAASAALADAGAAAASAPDAVRDADVVITMLPTAAAVESVIFDGGVAAAFAEGSVWAQMGTIGVQATLGFRDRLAAVRPGVTYVDAPVSGSKGPAEQGQLLILASGPETAASPLRPVFDAIGRKTVWLGKVGQGSIVKLVVNAYLSILIEGVAETMELADRLGISHQQLADVIEGGPLDAPLAGAKLHKMDHGDYAPEFRWSGPSKTSTSRSAPRVVRRRRSWPRCLASGTPPWPPGTAARTSAPPASPYPPQTTPASCPAAGSYSSGRSTVICVPAAAALWTWIEPPRASTRSARPARPEPRAGLAPPTPSSRTDSSRLPWRAVSEISMREACACFIALASASDAT